MHLGKSRMFPADLGMSLLVRCGLAIAVAAYAGSAQADWREGIGIFRIGMVGDVTPTDRAVITDDFIKGLGMAVELAVAPGYPDMIEAISESRLEYGVFSALAFATAFERCACVEPLVAPTGADGSIGIQSVLIARTAKLSRLADIRRARVAIGPASDVSGHQLPLATLKLDGATLTGKEEFLVPSASMEAAERMFVAGEVDAMFGWAPAAAAGAPGIAGGTVARLDEAGVGRSQFAVLWTSPTLTYGPHAVRSGIDAEPKRRLAAFLTGLKSFDAQSHDRIEPVLTGGFRAVTAKDYEVAAEVVRRIRLAEE